MRFLSITILSPDQKQQIFDLWNRAFPTTIALGEMDDLEEYLAKLDDHHHILLVDTMEAIKGWFFDFIRDEERWFIIMITPELHGSGWGQKLISKAMETNAALNGWVVNTLDYQTRDGKQYAPPVEFYRKLGFEIHPDIKLELPQINSIKITWKK